MHANCAIFYDNISYVLNADLEYLHILRETLDALT